MVSQALVVKGKIEHMWLVFALLAPLFWAIVHVLDEHCVEHVLEKPWMGVITSSLSSMIVFVIIPFIGPFVSWEIPSVQLLLLALFVGILIQISQIFYFNALSFSQAGIVAAYWNLIPALLPLASFAIFGEVLSQIHYLGIAVLAAASTWMYLLDYHFQTRSITFVLMIGASIMQVIAYLCMGRIYHSMPFFPAFLTIISGTIFAGLSPLLFSKIRKAVIVNFDRLRKATKFFLGIEFANLCALMTAQVAIKYGDPSLVAAVETTVPAYTLALSFLFYHTLHKSTVSVSSHLRLKILIILFMALGVWLITL